MKLSSVTLGQFLDAFGPDWKIVKDCTQIDADSFVSRPGHAHTIRCCAMDSEGSGEREQHGLPGDHLTYHDLIM